MLFKRHAAAAAASCLVLIAASAAAQDAPGVGTAAGVGGTAVILARRADAVLWNPALVGVYEGGPVRTSSFLSLSANQLPGSSGVKAAARLGLLSGRVEDDRFGTVSSLPWSGSRLDASAQVRWIAVQSRDLALTVDTRYASRAGLPAGLAESLSQDSSTGSDFGAERSLVSVASVAKGHYLGEIPTLGPVWAGLTVKGYYVHEAAVGTFADLPGPRVLTETGLTGAGGGGIDVGIAGLAGRSVWYGASVSNAYQATFQPSEGPRQRFVTAETDGDGGVQFSQTRGAEIREDDPDGEALAAAEDLWDRTRFPSVLRVGAGVKLRVGTVSGSIREVLSEGSLDAGGLESPRSVSWVAPSGAFRLGYGFGEARESFSAATTWGRCDRRWTAGLRTARGGGFGVFFDLTFGEWMCNAAAASR